MPMYDPDPEDPMAPMAQCAPGSPRYMAECLIEEYLLMGYSDDAVLALFRDPFYQAVHMLYRQYGDDGVRAMIADVRGEPTTTQEEQS